jgi:hypothetical protein
MLDLDAIEARVEAATEGPWFKVNDTDVCWSANGTHPEVAVCLRTEDVGVVQSHEANADFIAHARTDIPALVAELRAAREAIDELTAIAISMLRWRDDSDSDAQREAWDLVAAWERRLS